MPIAAWELSFGVYMTVKGLQPRGRPHTLTGPNAHDTTEGNLS